jgi:hypothetical protein
VTCDLNTGNASDYILFGPDNSGSPFGIPATASGLQAASAYLQASSSTIAQGSVATSGTLPFATAVTTGGIVAADFVTMENTGMVHIAPGHGWDDYLLGLREHLDIFCPVDTSGKFNRDGGTYAGLYVKDANPIILLTSANPSLHVHNSPIAMATVGGARHPSFSEQRNSGSSRLLTFVTRCSMRSRMFNGSQTGLEVPDFMSQDCQQLVGGMLFDQRVKKHYPPVAAKSCEERVSLAAAPRAIHLEYALEPESPLAGKGLDPVLQIALLQGRELIEERHDPGGAYVLGKEREYSF